MAFEDLTVESVMGRGRFLIRTPQGLRPLRVLHVSARICGERGKSAYFMHRALRTIGVDSLLVTGDTRDHHYYHLLSVLSAGVPAGSLLPAATLRGNRLCAEVDIIHIHDIAGFADPAQMRAAFSDKKFIWSFGGGLGDSGNIPAILPEEDMLVFPTREHASRFFAQTPCPAPSVQIVPPALPLAFYQNHLRPYAKEEYGFCADRPLVLCVLPARSGLARYREIIAPLAAEKGVQLAYIGPEDVYNELGIEGQRLDGLPRHTLTEEALALAAAEVLLLPGAGGYDWLLAWEALGHGLPVASPECYIAREVVGDCGFSCRAGGEEELGRAIAGYCRSDESARNALRQRCLRKAAENCGFAPRAEYYARACLNLLKNGG